MRMFLFFANFACFYIFAVCQGGCWNMKHLHRAIASISTPSHLTRRHYNFNLYALMLVISIYLTQLYIHLQP
jgi:hypothetical protein